MTTTVQEPVTTGQLTLTVYAGIDWSEDHHDYAIVDTQGQVLVRRRVPDDLTGLAELLAALEEHGAGLPVPVVLETDRSLLVDELRRTQHPVYAINPKATSRYRDRHRPSGGKADKTDAVVLANIARTDLHVHRRLPQTSMPIRALNQIARAHDDSGQRARKVANELRSLLRLFYPSAQLAFQTTSLVETPALQVLLTCPTPAHAERATIDEIDAALRRGGRQRGIGEAAEKILTALQTPTMRTDPDVEATYGATLIGLVHTLLGEAAAREHLHHELETRMSQLSLDAVVEPIPGMALILGGRILSEIGDDVSRFPTPASLKGYAGTAPITLTSGKFWGTHVRWACNKRLQHAAFLWANRAILHSAGARAHYDRKRAEGKSHTEAQRHLSNRLIGCLWHCLTTGEQWSDLAAFGVEGRPARRVSG